jgi:hypothetical protein
MKKYIFALSCLFGSSCAVAGGPYYNHYYYSYGGYYRSPIIYPVVISQPYYAPVYVTPPQPQVIYQQQQQPVPLAPTMSSVEAQPNTQESNVYTGNSRIAGDPDMGHDDPYNNWKKACDAWKKQMTDLNSNRVLSLDCGEPVETTNQITSQNRDVSQGIYKLIIKN